LWDSEAADVSTAVAGSISIGTLGGIATFAGEATIKIKELYPELGKPVYFKSIDDCWLELKKGTVDTIVLGLERTNQQHQGKAILTHGFYVMGYMTLPLICNLYVKPGTRKENIRRITGHGSINQCLEYLDKNFPDIPREVHGHNSVEAARIVMSGNGEDAVIGSGSLPLVVPGLATLFEHVDDGAIVNWSIVSSRSYFDEYPEELVISAHSGEASGLSGLISLIAGIGYQLTTIASFPVASGVANYDYLLTFKGQGTLQNVNGLVSKFAGARLVGAYVPRR
jgi:prephenate dehydratase